MQVRLDGASNFREIGGYLTAQGQRIRPNMVYRSDDLSRLSRADRVRLARLNLKLVCDLRGARERETRPDRLGPGNSVRIVNLPIPELEVDREYMIKLLLSGRTGEIHSEEWMKAFYRRMVTRHASEFGALLQLISDPANIPVLIHCTGGKDRTGLAVAFILLALGVPTETVFDDYLLTNTYTAKATDRKVKLLWLLSRFGTKPDQVRSLFGAKKEYLQVAFDTITQAYGSIDAYLHYALGVTPETRERLCSGLLLPRAEIAPSGME